MFHSKLSLVCKLGLPVNFDLRKIKFDLKKGGIIIFEQNLDSLDFQKATERVIWSFELKF